MSDLARVIAAIDDWEPAVVGIGVCATDGTRLLHGDTDTVLPLASLSKPLTAYAVLIAAHDGLLRLDEPAGPAAEQGATVAHLLAHAGGLAFDPSGVLNRPGTRRIYSNWGYEVLGDLVAERAGVPFADFLQLEVLSPLGMDDTRLEGSPAADGSGTVADVLTFAGELLAPTLLPAETVADATTVAFADLDGVLPGFGRQRPNDWGLGVEIRGTKAPHWLDPALPPETFGHFGQSGSFFWVEPRRGLACASLAGTPFGPWAAAAWPPMSVKVLDAFDATDRH